MNVVHGGVQLQPLLAEGSVTGMVPIISGMLFMIIIVLMLLADILHQIRALVLQDTILYIILVEFIYVGKSDGCVRWY